MSDRRTAPSASWIGLWVVVTLVVSAGILLASEAQFGVAPLGDLGAAQIQAGTPTTPGHQDMYCVLNPKAAACKGTSVVGATPDFVLVLGLVSAALMLLMVAMLVRKRRGAAEGEQSSGILASPRRTSRRPPTDPREAILAAVANLEEHVEITGVRRHGAEPATEFLRRGLPRDTWSSRECRELVKLYWTARFSDHNLDGADAAVADHCVRLLTRSTMPGATETAGTTLLGRTD